MMLCAGDHFVFRVGFLCCFQRAVLQGGHSSLSVEEAFENVSIAPQVSPHSHFKMEMLSVPRGVPQCWWSSLITISCCLQGT